VRHRAVRKIRVIGIAGNRRQLEEPVVQPDEPGSAANFKKDRVFERIDGPKGNLERRSVGDRVYRGLRELLQAITRDFVRSGWMRYDEAQFLQHDVQEVIRVEAYLRQVLQLIAHA